ncbi:porin [Methylorubrum populi]|uniref:porin n=1 Tax=Methylorubrum rhodesianum TaxID=29427 RepID=UPI00190BF79C|nr:porin [Methylorubrum rhodesianum]MBK3406607.1 porin [Methylorubrum rhodesianum]MBY0138821.1 porin [Methylorubrum populi]
MRLLKVSLLGSVAVTSAITGAQAADLPIKKAAPIEYVRVCSAYGAGFFYIPGTDTCLRVSGRARFEVGYNDGYSRNQGAGDTTGYRGLARINLDARTQTGYGTLRAFVRLEFASRTGYSNFASGTQTRIGNAFSALGQDQFGRAQQFVSTEKAFIQFAGLTAGRASSFFDFYANDYEIIGGALGSNLASTNLLAYTSKLGDSGFSASLSLEDPTFRKNTIFSASVAAANAAAGTSSFATFGALNAPSPVFLGFNAAGQPTGVGFVDVIERNRMPDFVGALRYDAAWGSAQVSAAVKDVNTGNFLPNQFLGTTGDGAALTAANAVSRQRPSTEYGWAIQGGVKFNLPFIAPGDGLYLQGAYGEGATLYTGYSNYSGSYASNTNNVSGASFNQFFNDSTLNPLTGRLELSRSFTVVGSYLHYWTPEWRSAFFASYGELSQAPGARAAQGIASALVGGGPGAPGTRTFALNQTLRDTYQIYTGASVIWSPVKDLDIGLEGIYTKIGVTNGRVVDLNKSFGVSQTNIPLSARTVSSFDTVQLRMRVQRDF